MHAQATGTKFTDIRVKGTELYFLPVQTRVPLKFGAETLTSVTCARVRLVVEDRSGNVASGWGETPLSVQWVWPSEVSHHLRDTALQEFSCQLAESWAQFEKFGHPLEIGHEFQRTELPELLDGFNSDSALTEQMPWLAALVCCSLFDLALHDAYGVAHNVPIYETYNQQFMNRDLSYFIKPAEDVDVSFACKYPCDYLVLPRVQKMPVWHLVGGLDPLLQDDMIGDQPDDDEPVLLGDWIDRDGITCLKVKLRGNDRAWDYKRLIEVSRIASSKGPYSLTADFNCTVTDPQYVNDILDELRDREPAIYEAILYVEQPFPYDLETNRINVHSVASRKPLLMDESAHDWELVQLGRSLGWTGVALKTCKTQTGALLTLCWAKAHSMDVMVQDLTNPMLAQIPHLLLAAHADTMMGVESNAMQFYPRASDPEAQLHPGSYRRRDGQLDLSTVEGAGFGYRIAEISRDLGEPRVRFGLTDT